jgi:hypothetical protein
MNVGLVCMPTRSRASLICLRADSEGVAGNSRRLSSLGQRSRGSSALETGQLRTVSANLSNSVVGEALMKMAMKFAKPWGVRAAKFGASCGFFDRGMR